MANVPAFRDAEEAGVQELTARRQEKLKGGSMMLMPQCMVKIDDRDTNAIVLCNMLDIFDGCSVEAAVYT